MPISVLYIAGPARSGSTLLSNILGELPGFFNVGEMAEIFNFRLQTISTCGCGVPIHDCDLWNRVLSRFSDCDPLCGMEALSRTENKIAHSWKLPWLLLKQLDENWQQTQKTFLGALSLLYHTVADLTGCQVIVDASKNSGYAFLLENSPGIKLHIVHLLRDSRPSVHSWLHTKEGLWRESLVHASLAWNTRNLMAEILGLRMKARYLRLRYEDFLDDPIGAVDLILRLTGTPACKTPFCAAHEVVLNRNHSIFGNPDRFNVGHIRIREKGTWKSMPTRTRRLITGMTWPLLLRYAYPLAVKACR